MATSQITKQKLRGKPWQRLVKARPLITTADHLCTAYYRRGADLIDSLVVCEEHVLVVVESGSLVLESSQCCVAVKQGDSALVPVGKVRVTEVPAPGCEMVYWLVLFGPSMIRTVLGDGVVAENLAKRVAGVFTGVYPQRRTLISLHAHGTQMTDATKVFRILFNSMAASVFMFLQHAYYPHRYLLQQAAIYELAAEFPGGAKKFHQLFRLYHGMTPAAWLKRRKAGIRREGAFTY